MRSGKRRGVAGFHSPTHSLLVDRRACRRYPLELEIQYKLMEGRRIICAGDSRTRNMSSNGILFTPRELIAAGTSAELAIAWPALLNSTVPMKLLAFGRVVRSDSGGTAIAVTRYEFRTQGVRSLFPVAVTSKPEPVTRLE